MEIKTLATVNGAPITNVDVDEFLAGLGQRGQAYNTPEGRAMILDQLINSKLFLIDAQRNLLEAEPAFQAQLKKLKETLLTNYAVDKYVSTVTVSDNEVEAYYNENTEQFKSGETVNAAHILVETAEKAKEIYDKINKGEISFADAAKEYSSCPSKERGGDLGEFGKGQMVPEFDQAVFEMEVGAITAVPVKTQFGYHLIKLNAKSPAKTVALAEIRDRLREKLVGEKQQKAYESRVNQLKIAYPVDKML